MQLYLAAPWIDRELMPAIATKFETAGHTITHKWWESEGAPFDERRFQVLQLHAIKDYQGVIDADKLVLLNTAMSEGKSVEIGIALASGLDVIGIGKAGEFGNNVFHFLPEFTWVDSVEDAIVELGKEKEDVGV